MTPVKASRVGVGVHKALVRPIPVGMSLVKMVNSVNRAS